MKPPLVLEDCGTVRDAAGRPGPQKVSRKLDTRCAPRAPADARFLKRKDGRGNNEQGQIETEEDEVPHLRR